MKANLFASEVKCGRARGYKKQPTGLQEKFKLTIQGFLIHFLREHGPCTVEELKNSVSAVYHDLRTKSGNRYKTTSEKTFQGAVSNNKLFCVRNNVVTLNSEAAEEEEELAVLVLSTKSKHESHRPRLSAQSSCNKHVTMLNRIRRELLENSETAGLVNKPLPGVSGNEDLFALATKFGQERVIGLLQGFHFAKLYFTSKHHPAEPEDKLEGRLEFIQKKLKTIEEGLSHTN